jgi:hypothetical protein
MKKPIGLVQFWFYKPKTEKTELNSNRKNRTESKSKKQSQTEKTEPNRKKPSQNRVKSKKSSQIGLNRFRFF